MNESLNSSQERPVEHVNSATLVIAGPGSGKTRTLIAKVQRILNETTARDGRILALTFTNKAAREMLERLRETGDEECRCVTSTFHSFACELLRQHGHLIGIQPDFGIVVEDAERQAILQNMSAEDAQIFSGKSSYGIFKESLSDIGKAGTDPRGHSATVKRYCNSLLQQNRVDMDFVLPFIIRLLEEHPAAQKLVRVEFPFVCVDEFQDSNVAQMAFLRLIASVSGQGLFVVADDDQLIYAWNGASVERIAELRAAFNPSVFQLPENYRCCPEILELANRLIGNNDLRDSEKLPLIAFAESAGDGAVSVHEFESNDDECSWVCEDIHERYGANPSRIAVLCRNRKTLEPIRDRLQEFGINAELVARQDNFLTSEFRWLQLMLRAIARPSDAILLSTLADSFNGMPDVHTTGLEAASLSDLVSAVLPQLSAGHCFVDVLSQSLSDVMESPECFQNWISDAAEAIQELNRGSCEKHLANLSLDERAWQEITDDLALHFGDDVEIGCFVQELDMRSKAPTSPDDSVCLMTVHGAKGLEFKHVYIVGMQDDCMPDFRAIKEGDRSPQMEEERRACFVAITRAESNLTFTYSQRSNGYRKYPSRFLDEMGLEFVEVHDG